MRLLAEAKALWRAELPAADFDGITVSIGDLPGLQLGFTLGKSITIDATAAGWGWSTASSVDGAHIDLLTVVRHELGHALGFDHDDADVVGVMADLLAPTITRTVAVPSVGPALLRPALPTGIAAGRATMLVAPSRSVVRGSVLRPHRHHHVARRLKA